MPPAELHAILTRLHWSATDLSEEVGCARSLAWGWLKGRSAVPPAVATWLRAIDDAFRRLPAPKDWQKAPR